MVIFNYLFHYQISMVCQYRNIMKNISELMINVSGYMISLTATKEIIQIIALVFSIIGTILITFFRLKDWYDKAKADGKITKEEIKELETIVKDGKEKIDKDIDKGE